MSAKEDAALLAGVAAGDVRAMGALYDTYAASLLPIAVRIVGTRAEGEDVLHDAFVAVAERAGQYSPARGTVSAWLVALVRNLAIDRTRRRQRRSALGAQVLAHEPVESLPDPETNAAMAANRRRVRAALATLAPAQRQTLEQAFYEGLSYSEIAAREEVPVGTIKSRAARAFASLREALDRAGPVGARNVLEVEPQEQVEKP